jgi:hypothetical protein
MSIRSKTLFGLMLALGAPSLAQDVQGPPSDPVRPASRAPKAARLSLDDHVTTARFIAKDAEAKLGHGPIIVKSNPDADLQQTTGAVFEAALVDQLAKAGYNTAQTEAPDGQLAELIVTRTIVEPEAAKQKPVSGTAMMGISNRGSMMGLALNIDLGKARKAIIATQIKVRIKDRTTQATLWEGRASMETRDGDAHWTEDAIATRLAAALFDGFGQPGQAHIVSVQTP